jgi:hypothetical protein
MQGRVLKISYEDSLKMFKILVEEGYPSKITEKT